MTAALVSGAVFMRVAAQSDSMTDQQIELIRNSCSSTKNTLNQLHSSDALLRVNRGQIYESMSTKLMDKFNSRVSSNGLDNSGLISATNNYGTTLNVFRTDYITYEKQLTSTITIDCSKQPVAFYDAVTLARTERNQVHTDITKLDQSIDQYQALVDQFGKDYQTALQGVKQ
jgi:hypothetical protein